jgi:hypothetical protein
METGHILSQNNFFYFNLNFNIFLSLHLVIISSIIAKVRCLFRSISEATVIISLSVGHMFQWDKSSNIPI